MPTFDRWDRAHLSEHRLVARIDDAIVGWAALAPVSDRCVYGGVAEDSVYVAADARGRGVGRALLSTLVERAEDAGIWTVQTGIFPENAASVQLHLRCGFRVVGHARAAWRSSTASGGTCSSSSAAARSLDVGDAA